MKYYYKEHIEGYQQVKAEGKTAWDEIHGGVGFDNFSSRPFLERVLPWLRFSVSPPSALEYGCGTGPGACFLAERGFQVDGIDLISTAIDIARQVAQARHLDIHYAVQDVCELPLTGKTYDVIVDSYCLQGIVTDSDRARLFATVQARLKPGGYYLISTALFDANRFDASKPVVDEATGRNYYQYGPGLFHVATDIVCHPLNDVPDNYPDAVNVNGVWYLPNRRHLKPPALKRELEAAGFVILYQDAGHVVCVPEGSPAVLHATET